MREVYPEFHKEFFQRFTQELRRIIIRENHPYKYKNEQQIVDILNDISSYMNREYNTNLSFYLTKDETIGMESENIFYEISLLPYILFQFKRCYRCGKECENGTKKEYASR